MDTLRLIEQVSKFIASKYNLPQLLEPSSLGEVYEALFLGEDTMNTIAEIDKKYEFLFGLINGCIESNNYNEVTDQIANLISILNSLKHSHEDKDFRNYEAFVANKKLFNYLKEKNTSGPKGQRYISWFVFELSQILKYSSGRHKGATDWNAVLKLMRAVDEHFFPLDITKSTTTNHIRNRSSVYLDKCKSLKLRPKIVVIEGDFFPLGF